MKTAAERSDPEAAPVAARNGGSARLAPRSYGLAFADGRAGLAIGRPDDPAEHDADALAVRALAGAPPLSPRPGPPVLRRAGNACRDEDKLIRRYPLPGASLDAPAAPPALASPLARPGSALDPAVRRMFERRSEAPPAAPTPAPAFTPQRAPTMLQRRCACGGSCPRCVLDEKIQPRLRIGGVADVYEREADEVAGRLVAEPPPPTTAAADLPPPPPPAAAPELTPERLSFGGDPLAPAVRDYFEPRLGHDLSGVRVHAGDESSAFNDGLNAYAFTYGSHVWLGSGQRQAPGFVLAHELAHVVQQGGARPLEPGPAAPAAEPPTVRRLGLSDEFWIPLGAAGPLKGNDLHEELLGVARTGNVDIEAPAPDATADDWGLSLQGSIDLCVGSRGGSHHVLPGLFFEGPNNAKTDIDVQVTTPRRHRRASAAATGITFAPSATRTGTITNITQAPDTVQIGELKPASPGMLERGRRQVENYRQGMIQAANLTNAWAELHKRPAAQRWTLNPPTLLPDNAVTFAQGGRDMRFDPANPRRDTALVLGRVNEVIGGRYSTRVIFNPATRGLDPIMGGLYAQPFQPGSGLWMYFARPHPDDFAALQGNARVSLAKRAEMVIANRVQDQVLDPLFQAPQQVAPQVAPLRRPAPPTPARREAATLRRKPKPSPKLKDTFELKTWQPKVAALRNELFGAGAGPDRQKEMARLELLELAKGADENLEAAAPTTPRKAIKPEPVTIVSGAAATPPGGTPKTRTKDLGDIHSWLKAWTGRPVERGLGWFRQRFGTAFVWVSEKLATLRDKVREKFHNAIQGRRKATSGSKARLLLKALGKGLIQIAKVLLHRTVGLIVGAIETGAGKKLEKILDVSPLKLVEESVVREFDAFAGPLEDMKRDAEGAVLKAVEEYTGDLGWIADVQALSSKIGPVVEAASIALQCGTPPGWGCLKLLLRKLNECAIDAVLNMCPIQKEIAEVVEGLGPVVDLPKTLAEASLVQLGKIAPNELKDIFAEPVAGAGGTSIGEIECEASPPEGWCPPGIFGSSAGGGSGGKEGSGESDAAPPPPPPPPKVDPVHEELRKLLEEFKQEELEGLQELTESANAPPDAPLGEDQVRKMRELLRPGRGLSPGDFSAMGKGQASADVQARLKPLQQWLDQQASEAIKKKLLEELKNGKYDAQHADMGLLKQHWRFLKPYRPGEFKNWPVLMWNETQKGAGVADGRFGECHDDGKVPVEFTRVDIVDADGKAIPIVTPFTVKDGQISTKSCAPAPVAPAEPAPPKPAKPGPGTPAKPAQDPGGSGTAPPAGSPPGGRRTEPPGGGTAGGGPKVPGTGQGTGQGTGGGSAPSGVDLKRTLEFCPNVMDCRVGAYMVVFEEVGGDLAQGWFVLPGDRLFDPKGSGSIVQSAANPSGALTLKPRGDGSFDVLMLDSSDVLVVVGRAKPLGDQFELLSGPALDQLKTALQKFVRSRRGPGVGAGRSTRMRFK